MTDLIFIIEDLKTAKIVKFENDKPTLCDLKRQIKNDIEITEYKYIIYTTGIAVQIVDEDAILPTVDGRVFCELVSKTSSRKFKKLGKEPLIQFSLISIKQVRSPLTFYK
jgi:hypothetical protein